MIQLQDLENQLKAINSNYKFFGRPEIRELAKVISPNEQIFQATNGYYEAGFAFLVITNHRLLLIDKKPMFLTLEDIRFDMISEVDFNHRLLNATLRVYTPNKSLIFTTWNHAKLRDLSNHLQEHVMQSRQHDVVPQQQFTRYVQSQVSQAPLDPQPISTGSILPALAQTAMQGATAVSIGPSTAYLSQPYMSQRFVAPLSRNPYAKTPLMVRHRQFPGS